MDRAGRQTDIARLRAQIARIERRPAWAEAALAGAAEGLPAPVPGLLEEVFADETRHGAALFGFALARARGFVSPARPALVYLQRVADGQEMGLPYGPGLAGFGLGPENLVLVRVANAADLLWAAEEAVVCRAVAAVIADVTGPAKALDFTAARRLSLRAGASGTGMVLLRYGRGREASPAPLRWHVAPAPSAMVRFDERAPGAMRWQVRLEKHAQSRQGRDWLVELTKNGLQPAHGRPWGKDRAVRRQALSGPGPARLADRQSQTA